MFERKGKLRTPLKPHINSYQHSSRITELLNTMNKLALILLATLSMQSYACDIGIAEWITSHSKTMNSWQGIYKSFKNNPRCKSAAYGTTYSDLIVKLLAIERGVSAELDKIVREDELFGEFIIKMILPVATPEDMYQLTIFQCPKINGTLCESITNKAKDSYKVIANEMRPPQ